MQPQTFIRRPFDVNAVQVTPENAAEIASWCKGEVWSAEYKMMGMVVKLPSVAVPGNGPKKGQMIEALIGSWVVEHNRNFRVFRDQQFHESFFSGPPAGNESLRVEDLVEIIDPKNPHFGCQGQIELMNQTCVVLPGEVGLLVHPFDLKPINEYSEETKQRIAKAAAQALENPGLDKINAMREAAEAAGVGSLTLPPVQGSLEDPLEEINEIGGLQIGTAVVCREEHALFFGDTGEVVGFKNDHTLMVKLDYTDHGKVLEPVAFLYSELQTLPSMLFFKVINPASEQFGWVGWLIQDGAEEGLWRLAFRSKIAGMKDKCFSYMKHEIELYELGGVVPQYELPA